MTTPLIALTTYPPNRDDRFELAADYIHAVRRAGGRVVLVPPGEPDPAGLLAGVDGLVLTGGGDVDPARYDHPGHASVDRVDADRDAGELAFAEAMLAGDLPTLAVCRGMQIVNVAAGGSLVVDIPTSVESCLEHRRPPHEPVPHRVDVDVGSLVADVMGAHRVEPMSWHHQSVDRLGDGFAVTGRASDGVVEVMQHRAHPWLAAVQWHPELTAATDPTQQRLFDGVVQAARDRRRRRRP
jgi:putative glutamine amidotransferase